LRHRAGGLPFAGRRGRASHDRAQVAAPGSKAREADLGVASGKGQIFVKGEVVRTVPESKIAEALIEEALRLAGESA
jgi:hypothetical protein